MSGQAGWAGGSTRAWRRIRASVLARDDYQCQLRLSGCTELATQVHHVLGKAHPAGDNPAYLLASCRHCNNTIGDPQRGTQDTTIHVDATTL